MTKVVIADDQVIFRESLRFILEQDKEITVLGCAGNGKEAFDLCEKIHTDIVLMDISMPHCDGIEGTRLIKEKYKDIKVIMLTTFNDEESISKALKYGANGYVLKDINPIDLINVIKNVAKGLNIIHESSFDTVRKQFNNTVSEQDCNIANFNLSDRELNLINLIANGNSNKEIAQKLYITEGSTKNAITRILKKLNLKDRIELVIYAVKRGII